MRKIMPMHPFMMRLSFNHLALEETLKRVKINDLVKLAEDNRIPIQRVKPRRVWNR